MPSGPKLKVGLVFDDSLDSSDGVAQYVKTLGGWLSDQGHTVTYLVGQTSATDWQGGRIISLARNIKVVFNGNRLSMPLLPKLRLMNKVIEQEGFDVVHVMLPCSPLMASRIVVRAHKSAAVVGTFHIFPSGWVSKWGSRLLRLALLTTIKRFDSIVSVSQPAQKFAKQAYGIRSDILPNPVKLNLYSVNNIKTTGRSIVFLGRLVPRKGCLYLINAFKILSAQLGDASLTIAGAGPKSDDLKRLVQDKGLSDKVKFLGYIDEKDKPGLLASATVACFPSLYGESFGIVLLEAMAAGAEAVLGGNNPGYSSVLGGKPELLIDPKDTTAFAERLKLLLEDNGLRKELSEWQRQAVKEYDIENIGPKILSLYLRSIDKAGKKIHNNNHG